MNYIVHYGSSADRCFSVHLHCDLLIYCDDFFIFNLNVRHYIAVLLETAFFVVVPCQHYEAVCNYHDDINYGFVWYVDPKLVTSQIDYGNEMVFGITADNFGKNLRFSSYRCRHCASRSTDYPPTHF